jgi:hypothetical protein
MLDFLFGRTKAVPTTTTTVQTSKLPEEIAPYVTQVLEEAQKQYEIARDEGYQKYPGETIAPRTQAELDAIAGLQSLVGGQEKYIKEAEDELRGIPTEFTAEAAQKFMSPYQQAVTDIEKRKVEEDFRRRIMPEFERQAVDAGGMSGLGSRAGVQAARLGEAFSQQLGDIQAKGQQKAYEDAYRQFTDQGARERARAADLQNLGLTKFQTGLAEQGLAQQLAQADRAETQATYDEAFREYLEQEQYPESELAQFSSFVYGNPYLRKPDTTTTVDKMLQPTTSMGQGLLNLGLTGLNIYGRGTLGGTQPFSIGSAAFPYAKMKTGGRVVHRQEGGEVPNVYNQGQQIGSGLSQLASPVGVRRGFLGGIFPRPRQTNVIENIDNAAGSLNDYKETMDENMQNLRMATRGISQSYNQTFGPMQGRGISAEIAPYVQNILDQRRSVEEVVGMKTGGGLGSLPVVKRAVPGRIGTIPNLLPPVANQALEALSKNLTSGLPDRMYNPRQLSGMRKERIRDDIRRQGLRFAKRKAETERLGTKGIEDYAQSQAGILEAMDKGGLSGPILKAQEALTEKGMETKGFLNQLAAAYNAFAAGQDAEGMKRAEKKAEIEGKKVELQANLDRALLDIENKKADEINTLERQIDTADTEAEKEESELARRTAIEDQTNTRAIASAVAEFIKTNATLYSNMATRAKNNRLTSSDIKEITSQVARSFGYKYDPDDGSLSTGSGANLKTVKRDDPIYAKLSNGVTAFTKIMVTAIEEQGKTKGQAYQLGMEDQLKRDIIRTAKPQPTNSADYDPGVYYYNPVDGQIVRGTGDRDNPFEVMPGLIKKYRKRPQN